MNKIHYFNYPLSLMQFIKDDDDKNGLMKIIALAVLNFSEKLSYQKTSVANQIIYMYYRRPYFLSEEITTHLDEMVEDGRLIEDEDYHGFSGNSFTPELENEGMLSEFESNIFFYTQCVNVYREHQVISLMKLNPELISNIRNQYQKTKNFIDSFEKKHGTDAWTSISNEMLFEVYNGTLPLVYLRLVSAVKSVLNKRNFNHTYKSVLLCRMFGCKKANILNDFFKDNPEMIAKHEFLSRRRQWEKLIDTAMQKGLFSYYSTGRMFFVSVTMTKDELQTAINLKRQNHAKINISA